MIININLLFFYYHYSQAYQLWTTRNGEEPAMPGFDHMSNEQMFFLSWGQVGSIWCLGPILLILFKYNPIMDK